jgi:hypothetical protein
MKKWLWLMEFFYKLNPSGKHLVNQLMSNSKLFELFWLILCHRTVMLCVLIDEL